MLRKSLLVFAIAAFPATPLEGAFFIFDNEADFVAFNLAQGKVLKGFETFEEGNVPSASIVPLADPLLGNIPNVDPGTGFGFPDGLLEKNLVIQSNALGLDAVFPQFGGGLVAIGPGALSPGLPNSIVVGSGLFADSTDLIFTDPNHTGIGFDVITPNPVGGVIHFTVFDKNNIEFAKWELAATGEVFWGIWSDETIGRINIARIHPLGFPGGELVDNIQMWIPAPGVLALLGVAGLFSTRRRRR